jgi:hypothetical protein
MKGWISMIFVFGSNEAGRHGAGAALYALRHCGAQTGLGFGPSGTSFAIPTKNPHIQTLPLGKVSDYVQRFFEYAKCHPELEFKVTAIGCGLAGFRDEEMAPLFANAPDNCFFDEAWKPYLGERQRYWGRFKK